MSDFQATIDFSYSVNDIWIRRKHISEETKCDICDLIAKGYSHYTIAKMSCCSIAVVSTIENTLTSLL